MSLLFDTPLFLHYTTRLSVKDLYERTARVPCRIIEREGQPYLERYHIDLSLMSSRHVGYLHRFVGGGEDEALHDHPWECATKLIHGSYTERRLLDVNTIDERLVKAGDSHDINPYEPHQILAPAPETWTLFITGERLRSWHFYKPIPGESAYKMEHYKSHLANQAVVSAGLRPRHDWWNDPDCPTGATAGRQPLHPDFSGPHA